MNRDREQLIDFLLGELPGDEAREVEARLADDAAAAGRFERYREALGLLRAAADEGWAPRSRWRVLRPALVAAAAVLAIAFTLFFMNGAPTGPQAIYEPDIAYGYLRPEETDTAGNVPVPSTVSTATLRAGEVEIAPLGSERSWPIAPGTKIPDDSEVASTADAGVRIDLPHGGILFLGPVSTVQLRRRPDGETALRLTQGVACTVVGDKPIHVAVDTTDLLLDHKSGAMLMRRSPDEIVNLRGEVVLRYEGDQLFPVPAGERLPAACANDPQTAAAREEDLELDWYRDLVYQRHRCKALDLERPIRPGPDALLYLRLVPRESGNVSVRFGGEARIFETRKGVELKLRLRFSDLGPGDRLEVTPRNAVVEARLFEAVPR